MAAISSIITFIAQRAGGSVSLLQTLPLWERICNAAISYCRYVRHHVMARSAQGLLLP